MSAAAPPPAPAPSKTGTKTVEQSCLVCSGVARAICEGCISGDPKCKRSAMGDTLYNSWKGCVKASQGCLKTDADGLIAYIVKLMHGGECKTCEECKLVRSTIYAHHDNQMSMEENKMF